MPTFLCQGQILSPKIRVAEPFFRTTRLFIGQGRKNHRPTTLPQHDI
ncbi:MAG: hypothetical protein K6E73_12530 [Bacteroidales bacterium]|nr:hypothetical protein [Bacteroidales bacterium]